MLQPLSLKLASELRCSAWVTLFGATAASASGCAAAGDGMISVTVYGEEFIEEGIPESVFDDGWRVSFSEFRVSIEDVELADQELDYSGSVDLTEASDGEGQELGVLDVPPGQYTDGGYTISGLLVRGTATKDDETKSFDWTFEQATVFSECETTTRVTTGENATFQITVHADHFFYDSLVSEEPQVLFQPLADADADGDGEIAQAELSDTDIGGYDPGSGGDDTDDLWKWLNALERTVGHIDGESHCIASPVAE